jgi:hypothetical protein
VTITTAKFILIIFTPLMPQGYSDMYGRGRILNAINGSEAKFGLKNPWDILFTIQDPFVLEGLGV